MKETKFESDGELRTNHDTSVGGIVLVIERAENPSQGVAWACCIGKLRLAIKSI